MGNHKWGEWESTGHGSGDGTPAGVICARKCTICRCTEYRDSAAATHTGSARPKHGWKDSYGYASPERPACLGYDPLAPTA